MTDPSAVVAAAYIAAASVSVAAAIAGGFSLVGLFITKEQDTSKFRQAWIDELRNDIALLVAHAHQIQAYILISTEADNGERWKATHDDFLELNKASTRIKLRLNPIECDSRLILQSLREMEELFKDLKSPANRTDASFEKIFGIVSALERDAAPLLKKEWVRVKEGEPIYCRAKWLVVSVFVISVIVAIYFFARLLR